MVVDEKTLICTISKKLKHVDLHIDKVICSCFIHLEKSFDTAGYLEKAKKRRNKGKTNKNNSGIV